MGFSTGRDSLREVGREKESLKDLRVPGVIVVEFRGWICIPGEQRREEDAI